MTLFQTLVSAVLQSFSALSGTDPMAWQQAAQNSLSWDPLSPGTSAVFISGAWLMLLVLKRHDWVSMTASLLRVILTGSKPRTVDERMPVLIFLLSAPLLIIHSFFAETIEGLVVGPWITSSTILLGAALLAVAQKLGSRYDRKQKNILSLSYGDALLIGIFSVVGAITGIGPMVGILGASLFMNYRPPAAIKITYFAMTILYFSNLVTAYHEVSWQGSEPLPSLGWLHLSLGFVVAVATAFFTVLSTEQQVERKSVSPIIWTRIAFVAISLAGYWFNNR